MKDSEIKRFCLDFRKGILDGKPSDFMCYAVSAPLQSLLSIVGVETKLISGEVSMRGWIVEHFWLELPDGRIIDPTQDQFNPVGVQKYPKVYIGEKPGFYKSVV